ncbi:unnamed protein product [Sphagnum compactum]
MGKGMSPLRLFTQNSPKKLQQQIPSSSLMSSIEAAAGISGRQPLCPIVEAAATGSRKSLQAEPCAATNWSSSTPKSKRRVLGLENMQESNVGSNGEALAGGGIGAGMTPEKHVVIHAGFAQAAGGGASSAVKPKCTWQYKQPASHGLEIPSSSGLRRSPYVPSRSSLSESNAVFSRADSGCDSRATPSKNPTKTSVGSTTNSSSEAVALRPSGQFQGGSKNAASSGEFAHATPKGTSRMQGKPPIVDAAELRASCSGTLQTLAAATPSRNVTRALRYGMTSVNQNGSTCSVIAGSSLARGGGGGGALSSSGGKSVLQTSGMMQQQQQPSEHCMEQQQYFELEEDPTFWREHNVQVVIRLRPINILEASTQGFNRCVKQESAHCISWVGQPESRFTFDHVASEYITQEKLFTVAGLPMVENCMAGYNSCMFCYGQTGSGKTHTMLGDIVDLDRWPSDDRGMTPRVFEHLFAKIHLDEEHRKHENLRYICKCSFLEIYNEQITDLLEPSSTNLQIREDGKKGVYVENLSEVEVESVQDVVHLLLLGAMNRKVAATNLNGESSRSHSVFTCIIQSKWECESVTNTRFGRLNLVDLAGSERQKLSGAEGDRLKEAANINKSLSTLGLVIMILIDVANGKQRHVPYRDSKLTFLLQDSLGGNSKTTMIANISPSSCCALETLSTLKFAQRAKKIKNNAIVNEDASGDVKGLRQEIQELKEELDRCRRKDVFWMPSMWTVGSVQGSLQELDHGLGVDTVTVDGVEKARCSFDSQEFGKALSGTHITHKKLKALEGVLVGALRREQAADLTLKQLAAEIEQLNRLVKQREDDSQCSKMMLRFREDKIKRLESVANGFLSADAFLVQEKNTLVEELQLVQGRLDRNPELTRFAMENIRLLEQLRRLQEFYTGGDREAMADEISNLRDQVEKESSMFLSSQENNWREVEECRNMLGTSLEANSKLARQLEEVQLELSEAKAESSNQQRELVTLRASVLDFEAVVSEHTKYVQFTTKLKSQLQQREAAMELETRMWLLNEAHLDEQLNDVLEDVHNLHLKLQESQAASDALVMELQTTKASLAACEELVLELQTTLDKTAAQQRESFDCDEDSGIAQYTQEFELRTKLQEAHAVILKLQSKEVDCAEGTETHLEEGGRELQLDKMEFVSIVQQQQEQELEALKIALEEEWVLHPNVVESLERQKSFFVNELESLRMECARTLEWKDEVAAALKREAVAASQNVAHLVQKLENMKLALMAVTKESEEWAMKYEKLAKEKDGELRAAALQRQCEDSHARLICLQDEAGAADDEVLEKLERNSAALSIMGWWLCTKAEMQCKSEERMRAELKAASVGELQSRDTLVVSLQRELESSTEPIQEQDSLQSELHPQRELALQKEKLEELVANAADALKKKSTVLSVMLWWLHDKAEKSGLQEEMLRVQLCSSHGEIHEKDGLILSLQHELDHNQALLQAETQRHKLELERAKAREFVVEQEWSSRETELKAQVAALQMCADASQSQLLTKEKKVVELKELVAEQLGKWEAENETLMVAALEAEHQFLDKDQKLHLTQKSLVTLQARMTEAEVHERALSSHVEELLVGNEAAARENEKLRLEVSELRVNAERLELELLRLGSVNAERLTALESKLQKAQESVEDAETRMKLMVSEMEATSLATEKLESKAESLISGSLLVLQKELAKVLEEKTESEQLAAAEKSELLRDLNRLDSENLILKSDIQHLGVKLEHAKRLALEKELEMSAVKEDRHQIETKAKHVQENLETLIDAYTVSESKWEEEKDILTAENRKLASCMACRDMEFAALQEHKMILERSLHEVSENRGLLQQTLETLEAEWNAEKEKFSDCLAESSKLLSDKEKTMEAMQMELAEAHSSLCASSAKITLLLETNAVRHEEWVAERSQLQSELTHWEQYAAELHKSCSHVLSPLSENRTIPASNGRSSSKLFDDMKKEVERTRINCEELHAKLHEKDNAILRVQMEFGAVKAKSMQVECDLKNLHQEKEKLRHELAVVNSKLAEAQDEICCRKLQLQAYESELGRVMKMQIEAEQRRDQAELEWRKDREELETEKEAAKLDANEKGSEAATSLQKLETAQATLREAEHLVNALVRANGGAKYEALESKMELEQAVIEANNLLSGLEDEVNVTIGYAEMKMQVLGVELQDTKRVIEEERLKMPIGFHQELEEMLAVILHDYAMEAARAQARLQAVEADFDALQDSLKDTLCETKSQETGWAETAAELDILWATVAEKETESSNLQSTLHHSLECISKLEKLYAESQAENENLHSNLKSMDMRIQDSQAQVNEASAQQKVASAQLAAEVEKSRAEIHVLQTSLREAELLKMEVTEYQQRAVAAETALGDARMEMESLRWELKQKVDAVTTLEVDMNVLQEMLIEDLQMEQELELTKAAARGLREELDIRNNQIAFLEVDLSKKTQELSQLRQQLTTSKSSLCALETELDIKQQTIESLEDELLMVEQSMAHALEEATGDLRNLETEQDKLHSELLMLRKQLEVAQAVASERDEVAAEARQVAEICRTHAEEKEEEANLLGKSVEELESAVSALENQLSLVKQEAERQQLMREDMEMKIQGLENHVSMMQAALAETVAQSAEELREAKSVQKISDRFHFPSIHSSMVRISDLLLTVESQTAEYEQKVRALESVVEELKLENSRNGSSSAKTGSESALKVKGSLSPFTCMGMGLALQMSPQHDAKYLSYRCRIEELEALASSRQKEVFLLNTRLAEAESMTHDVIRDLVGVKKDLTSFTSMLGKQQVQQLAEVAQNKTSEVDEKGLELMSLRSQINTFIEERECWLQEIDHRRSETMAACISVEKLRKDNKSLIAENEKIKEENLSQQNCIGELKDEVNKLSGQQNLQQRIHHHTKIKEENLSLRTMNDDLRGKLRRSELLFARVNDELAQYRGSEGKSPFVNIDEEELLRSKLQEAEGSNVQVVQKLRDLCTAILKAAGVSESEQEVDPSSVAMDALQELEARIHSTEHELNDIKIKTKVAQEKRRLQELRAVLSPVKAPNNFTSLQRIRSPSPAPC